MNTTLHENIYILHVILLAAVPYRASPAAYRDKGLNYYDTVAQRQNY